MRRYLLRAFIALFAFAAGVAAATLFGGWLGLNSLTERPRAVHVSSEPRSCPSKRRLEAPLPPEPPLPTVAPLPRARAGRCASAFACPTAPSASSR